MSDKAKAARRLSVLAVAAVITQAVFGGVIVLSVGDLRAKLVHATLGQAFFCITVLFAFSMRESWRREPARPLEDSGFFTLKRLALLFTAAVFIQLELGAVMRHTGSGLAIHDFPTVFGGLLPPSGEAALDQINQTRLIDLGLDRVNYPKIWIHFGHRAWAMVVFALGIWLTVRTARKEANRGELLFPAMFIGGALVLQVILGGLIVWSGKQPHIATAHVALGASILAAGVIFTAQTFRLTREDAPAGATLADPGLATPPPGTAH